jgi:hypothetical protein
MKHRAKKTYPKKGLSGTDDKDKTIPITGERLVLYVLGTMAVGGSIYIASQYFKNLQEENTKLKADQAGRINGGVGSGAGNDKLTLSPNTGITSPNPNPLKPTTEVVTTTTTPSKMPDIVVPAVTYGYRHPNPAFTYPFRPDSFPLSYGSGGERVKMLQKALNEITTGATQIPYYNGQPTGAFADVTKQVLFENLGKYQVNQEDFEMIINSAQRSSDGTLFGINGLGCTNNNKKRHKIFYHTK